MSSEVEEIRTINLLNMSADDQKIVAALLQEKFPDGTARPFDEAAVAAVMQSLAEAKTIDLNPKLSRAIVHTVTIDGHEMKLRLSHSIIKSASGENRFEVVQHAKTRHIGLGENVRVGKGQFGVVKRATRILHLHDDKLEIETIDRVVKIQTFTPDTIKSGNWHKALRALLESTVREEELMRAFYPEVESSVVRVMAPNEVKLLTYMPNLGVELFDYISEGYFDILSDLQKLSIIRELAQILLDLKEKGIFHRDIKTENILIDPTTLKLSLIDFGFAQRKETYKHTSSGTVHYMAPEILERFDYASDLFSMAVSISMIVTMQHYNPTFKMLKLRPKQLRDLGIEPEDLVQPDEPYEIDSPAMNAVYDLLYKSDPGPFHPDLKRRMTAEEFYQRINALYLQEEQRLDSGLDDSDWVIINRSETVLDDFLTPLRYALDQYQSQNPKMKSKKYFQQVIADQEVSPQRENVLRQLLILYSKQYSTAPRLRQFFSARHHHHAKTIRDLLEQNPDNEITMDALVGALTEAGQPIDEQGTLAEIITIYNAAIHGRHSVDSINAQIAPQPPKLSK